MFETHNSFLAMLMDGFDPTAPKPKTPVPPVHEQSSKENMERMYRHQVPYWIPVGLHNTLVTPDVVLERPALNKGGLDWFGVEWQYAPSVHAPSVKPGFCLFEDIEDWEEAITFPDLDAIDWEANAALLNKELDPDKTNLFCIFNGCFERLHSLMGFENALIAMAENPEEVLRLFNRIADFKIALIDKLITYYPVDTIVYHDDWGAQKSSFFSTQMFEEMLYEPTKRIVDYVHSRGKFFTMHCCGCVEKLVPYMIKMGCDSWESAQTEVNDLPGLRKRVGSSFCFEIGFRTVPFNRPDASEEEVRQGMHDLIEPIAKDGPIMVTHFGSLHPNIRYWAEEEFYKISESIYKGRKNWEDE